MQLKAALPYNTAKKKTIGSLRFVGFGGTAVVTDTDNEHFSMVLDNVTVKNNR